VKTAKARMIFDCLRRAVQPSGAGLPDGQLLRQYFAYRDEAAFAALVRRHGPMVLAVCRRYLGRAEDAEDAFQAAFIVLARKGHRVAGQPTIGGWLHGVAYHVALNVRNRVARRLGKERQVEIMPHPLVMPEEDQSELLAVLDRELTRLPEKYRLPVVLCELEGRSRKEAARQLGLPEGTLSSRLGRARKMLAKRMSGHGAAVTGASLAALFASEAGAACVSGPLVTSTVRAAGGVVSAGVVALAEGVLKAMLLTKIKGAALALLLALSVGVGTFGLTYRTATAQSAPEPQTAGRVRESLAALAAPPEKLDLEALRQEVEALRTGLQATRERVKGLEAEVLALKAARFGGGTNLTPQTGEPKKPATAAGESLSGFASPMGILLPGAVPGATTAPPQAAPGAGPATVTLPFVNAPLATMREYAFPVVGMPPGDAKANNGAEAKSGRSFDSGTGGGTASGAANDTMARVRNAAASLMSDPTNKKAQETLKSAIEELNHQPERKQVGN
jgi:RNA polymerase sigma factor (sigma-70 family)